MGSRQPIFVSDANVVIDYAKTAPQILKLAATRLGPLLVPLPVAKKVKCWKLEQFAGHGLQLADMTDAQVAEVIGLSERIVFDDWCCVILARDLKAACITNDKKVRQECKKLNVNVMWGLELLIELARLTAITKAEARKTVTAISANSPQHFHAAILAEFGVRLEQF